MLTEYPNFRNTSGAVDGPYETVRPEAPVSQPSVTFDG